MNNKRKHKRSKVQCLACDSSFDHDYRRKYELNIHGGSQIKVIDVSLGVCASSPLLRRTSQRVSNICDV